MAKIHGIAGAYPMSEARKRLYLVLGCVLILIMGYGWLAGYATSAFGGMGAAAAALLGVGVIWGCLELVERASKRLRGDLHRFLRGGTAEEFVGWLLEELEDDWHVFHGIQLQDAADLDHVVVGPGGLFYIQTKSLRGLFSAGPDGEPRYNNAPTTLLSRTRAETMNLKERLTALLGSNTDWIEAVLAVPFAYVEGRGEIRNVLVLHQDNLRRTLESRRPRRLTKQDVERYARAIEVLAKSARQLRRDGKRLATSRGVSD